jgi:hypothetical protein
MYLYITILLIFLVGTIYINLFVIKKTCPESQVIYKYIPEDQLAKQFETKNQDFFEDLFTKQYLRLN